MAYIDGFVAPVQPGGKDAPPGGKDAYLAFARAAAQVFLDHGAHQVVETWGDDVHRGKRTDFWRAVEAGEDEGIVFSWIVWPSKEARIAGWEKAMADERMNSGDMPFDGKRMIYGGFEVILDTAAEA